VADVLHDDIAVVRIFLHDRQNIAAIFIVDAVNSGRLNNRFLWIFVETYLRHKGLEIDP
jgi:hypothetical protein